MLKRLIPLLALTLFPLASPAMGQGILCRATASDPSYSEGAIAPCSMDLTGKLRTSGGGGGGGNLDVGTTAIDNGTDTRVLYDNAGILGEYTISGSGNVAMTTSPSFTTPTLGVAAGTSLALGGATIGSNALAVTGTSLLNNRLTITQGTANQAVVASTGYSLTGSDATSMIDLAGTWNTSGTPTAFKLNITDTASNSASRLFDLQLSSVSVLRYQKGYTGISNNPDSLIITAKTPDTQFVAIGPRGWGGSASFSTGGAGFTFDGRVQAPGFGLFAAGAMASQEDVILGRRAAASLNLGAADAASPVAQTIGVQSVVAGTSNTAGANFTIAGSQGTGTGAGGQIIFQTATAGGSGSSQNALVQSFVIGAVGSGTPWTVNSTTDELRNAGTGATVGIRIGTNSGNLWFGGGGGNGRLGVGSGGHIGFASDNNPYSGTIDLIIKRRAAAFFQLGAADAASPVAQTLGVQSVVAGTSDTAGAAFTIAGSQGTGTGAGGSIIFQTAAAGGSGSSQNALAAALTLDSAKTATFAGAIVGSVQSLSGAGAVNVSTHTTAWITTGADAGTLADGVVGQFKWIVLVAHGGNGTLTPSNLANGTTLTFGEVGDSVLLQFLGTEWWVVANNGVVLA